MNGVFFIPAIFSIAIFTIYQFRNSWYFGSVSLLYFTYVGMNIAAIIGFTMGFEIPVLPLSREAISYFSISMILLLVGFSRFQDRKLLTISIENIRIFNYLKVFLLISSFGAIVFFFPFAWNALHGDINTNRYDQINMSRLSEFGLINTFFSLVANSFVITQLIGMIELALGTIKHKIIGYLLFLSSLSYYIYILAYVGRDGYVLWIMSSVFSLTFMWHFLKKIDRRVLLIIILIFFVVLSVPFIHISKARFGDGTHSELELGKYGLEGSIPLFLLENIIDYSGQQIANFNDQYQVNAPPRKGGENFARIMQIIEKIGIKVNPIYDRSQIDQYYFQKGTVPWEFATVIGSFVADFGKSGAVLVILFLLLLNHYLCKIMMKSKSLSFSQLLLFMLTYHIVYWGVFYFRHFSANLFILFVVFLALIFRIFRQTNSITRINKRVTE